MSHLAQLILNINLQFILEFNLKKFMCKSTLMILTATLQLDTGLGKFVCIIQYMLMHF